MILFNSLAALVSSSGILPVNNAWFVLTSVSVPSLVEIALEPLESLDLVIVDE